MVGEKWSTRRRVLRGRVDPFLYCAGALGWPCSTRIWVTYRPDWLHTDCDVCGHRSLHPGSVA